MSRARRFRAAPTPGGPLGAGLALLALALGGCSLAELDPLEGAEVSANQCESDAQCGAGVCAGGECRSLTGQFSTVLVEVVPPTTSVGGGDGHRVLLEGLLPRGGAVPVALPPLAEVEGRVTFTAPAGCVFENGTARREVPVTLTATASEQLLGLPARSFSVSSPTDAAGLATGPLALTLPPGVYDLYVAPALEVSDACALPPQLLRRQTIAPGPSALELSLAEPSVLRVVVGSVPGAEDLAGWEVELVDARSGHALSPRAPLVAGTLGFSAELSYRAVIGDPAAEGHELLRLRPPEGQVGPTLVWERAALELFAPGEAQVAALSALPPPVELEARVVDAAGHGVPGAELSLVATEFTGLPAGTLASFATRGVSTDATGRAVVRLPPGSYRVFAVPPVASGLAATEGTFAVSTAPYQAGQELTVPRQISVTGRVTVGWGPGALLGAQVHAAAAPTEGQVGTLDAALGRKPFGPRAAVAPLEPGGGFVLAADPAVYDLSVRAPDGSGFAWLVRPNLPVSTASPVSDLGSLAVSVPVVYTGVVSGPAGPVPDALLRAYVYLDADRRYTGDPAAGRSVVQVAEARADGDGVFRLFLPERLE